MWCGGFGLKNLKVASGLVCCVSVCGSLGLPHHVAPWEHQHWNGEAVKQQVRCLLFLFLFLLFSFFHLWSIAEFCSASLQRCRILMHEEIVAVHVWRILMRLCS